MRARAAKVASGLRGRFRLGGWRFCIAGRFLRPGQHTKQPSGCSALDFTGRAALFSAFAGLARHSGAL